MNQTLIGVGILLAAAVCIAVGLAGLGYITVAHAFLFVLLFTSLLLIGLPLVMRRSQWSYGRETSEQLETERDRDETIRAIKDLDVDHDSGRLDDATYQQQRKLLLSRAVDLASQIKQRRQAITAARRVVEAEIQAAGPLAPDEPGAAPPLREIDAPSKPKKAAKEPGKAEATDNAAGDDDDVPTEPKPESEPEAETDTTAKSEAKRDSETDSKSDEPGDAKPATASSTKKRKKKRSGSKKKKRKTPQGDSGSGAVASSKSGDAGSSGKG